MHTPVLLEQTLIELHVQPGKKYIDATYGLGGHSREILAQGGQVLGIEWDAQSLAQRESEELANNPHLALVSGNFADIESIATDHDWTDVDGILFDYGLSMWQIKESGKGLSYENDDEPLDMRIDDTLPTTAEDIITSYSEDQLYDTFTRNAEEINSRAIAHALVQSRRIEPIRTVGDLKRVVKEVKGDMGTLARVFQALRIEVNHEFDNLTKGLEGAMKILASDGRIVIITFHPSEDRIVKQWTKSHDVHTIKRALRAKQGQRFERSALLRVITHKSL